MAELKMDFTKMAEGFVKNAKKQGMFVGWWIPVSERLPEEDGCYLVTTTGTNNDIIDIAYYTDGIWHKASRIKAWMPLPEPYKASPTGAESEVQDGISN